MSKQATATRTNKPAATDAQAAQAAAQELAGAAAQAEVPKPSRASKATGAKAAKVAKAEAEREARAAVLRAKAQIADALVAKAAGLELTGNVTERLWQLFNTLGAPGTFPRAVAVAAALEHGLSPASASLAFARWQRQPGTPTSKHIPAK